nr:MAG TPA: hypothetical protein [Caudoviricetes sp.]
MDSNAVVSLDNIAGGLLGLSTKTDNTKQCVQLGVLSCVHHEYVRGAHEVGEHGVKLLKVSKSSFLSGDLDISLRGHLSRSGLQSSCKTVKTVCVLGRSKDACVELARDCVLSLLQIHLVKVICSSLGNAIHLECGAKNTKSGGLLLNGRLRCDWLRTKCTECSRRWSLNALIAVDQIRSARSIHAVVEGERTEQVVVGDKLIDKALCELIVRVGCKGSEINHYFPSPSLMLRAMPEELPAGLPVVFTLFGSDWKRYGFASLSLATSPSRAARAALPSSKSMQPAEVSFASTSAFSLASCESLSCFSIAEIRSSEEAIDFLDSASSASSSLIRFSRLAKSRSSLWVFTFALVSSLVAESWEDASSSATWSWDWASCVESWVSESFFSSVTSSGAGDPLRCIDQILSVNRRSFSCAERIVCEC